MPAKDGAVTSRDVRRTAKEVLEDDSAPAVNEPMDEISKVENLVAEQKKNISKESADKILADTDSRFLLKMERKNASWQTRGGVVFSQEHPYQLVDEDEMDELLDEGGFRRADPREVVKFYQEK